MATEDIRSLRKMGMEIGSHTMSHRVLTKLKKNEILSELTESKKWLEDLLGEEVTAFCYPKGKFNARVRRQAVKAGYALARTTAAFRIGFPSDPWTMPTSFQFFPHRLSTHIRHAAREGNLRGLWDWQQRWGMETDLLSLTAIMSTDVVSAGGVLHIWGHSWEVDENGLWNSLEMVLASLKETDYEWVGLTNTQVVKAAG